jgi:hypothetical protein
VISDLGFRISDSNRTHKYVISTEAPWGGVEKSAFMPSNKFEARETQNLPTWVYVEPYDDNCGSFGVLKLASALAEVI